MNLFTLNTGLALLWALLTGVFTLSNFVLGFIIGYLVLLTVRSVLPRSKYFQTAPYALEFAAYFVWELVAANVRVAVDVVTPRHRMKPRVLAIPLDAGTDLGITLLANLISLTPGSLSLDISADRVVLYIHAMYAENPESVRQEIKKGLERRVIRLLRGIEGKRT